MEREKNRIMEKNEYSKESSLPVMKTKTWISSDLFFSTFSFPFPAGAEENGQFQNLKPNKHTNISSLQSGKANFC